MTAIRLKHLSAALHGRPRLLRAMLTGLVAGLLALIKTGALAAFLIGFDIAVIVYLAAVIHLARTTPVEAIRRRAAREDEPAIAILWFTVLVTAACFAGIFLQLSAGATHGYDIALAALTTLCGFLFLHAMFALHYAHEYYDGTERDGTRADVGGLTFGGPDLPDYFDFLYFSFVIGMTAQTADVNITSPALRRIVLLHGLIAFVFNAVILALTVSIGASLLHPG